jgi:hypothetical protein
MINGSCRQNIKKNDLLPICEKICYWKNLTLLCYFYPMSGGVKYKIIDNKEDVFCTNYLVEAIREYNERASHIQ